MKKMLVFAFGFGVAMLSSAAAFAACTPGNNGNGCSWSCNGNTMLVSCQNTATTGVVPRCFTGDADGGPLPETPCTDQHGSSVAPPVKPGSAEATKSEAMKSVMNLKAPQPTKPTKTEATKTEAVKTQVKK